MTKWCKIFVISSPFILFAINEAGSQPVWVAGTPSLPSAGPLTLTLDYGLDRVGTVYYIVYNFENTAVLTSSFVRSSAISGPSGSVVAAGSRSVRRSDAGRVLQYIINVLDPDRIHTVYIVAADSRARLQSSPVRLTAATLPCQEAVAGTGGDICGLSFTLNAVPGYGTGTWTMISGPGSARFSPDAVTPGAIVTVSDYGQYVFRWTEVNGACTSFADITVTFYRQPEANAGSGGNSCGPGFSLGAIAPPAGTGTWTMTGGTGTASFFPDAGAPDAVVTVSAYGTKVFTWTVINGPCSGRSDVTVSFYQQPVADAGHGGNNCGLEYFLNAAAPAFGSGTWSVVSGPDGAVFTPDANTPGAKVTAGTYGTYILRWTVTNGSCSAGSNITVGFSENVSANAGNGGDECDLDFKLGAVPHGVSGKWSKVNGQGDVTFLPDADHADATVSVSQYGEYDFAWTETNLSCSSVDIIRVVFHGPPAVQAGQDIAICKGNSIRLNAEGTGSFQWTPSQTLDNPGISNPLATPLSTTTYTVILKDRWNCTNSDQVVVEVREKPVVSAGPDQSLDFLFETFLEAGKLTGNETGEWSVLNGTGEFSDKSNNLTEVTGLSLGENSFLWKVSNSVCPAASDTVNIIVNNLIIPTLITPNMDGKNDYFILKGLESMGRTLLIVFNRWGEKVYTNDNYLNNWDGKDSNGNPLPPDTYFYVVSTEKIKSFSGYIVIRR